jgi:nucleotide-binding universal stress UspA family protein
MAEQQTKTHDAERRNKRSTDGGTYLMVADGSDEMKAVLTYAIEVVRRNNARVALVHIIDKNVSAPWGNVEHMIKKELRDKAEKYIWTIAKKVNDETGLFPSLFIAEGDVNKEIMSIISEPSNNIRELLLATEVKGGAGPLVTYFTTKVASKVNIPITVVPGSYGIKREEVEVKENDDTSKDGKNDIEKI